MKYIMFECQATNDVKGEEPIRYHIPIIFPDVIVHKFIMETTMMVLLRRHKFVNVKPIRAGFINMHSMATYGESESLGLKSDPEDGRTISSYSYNHGIV